MPFARSTTAPAFRDAWAWLGKEAERFREEVRDLPPSPRATRTGLQAELQARFDLEGGGELAHVVPGVARLLREGSVHVTSPRYLGLFNPTVLEAGILGDVLAALYNLQLAAWSHAPAATEMERAVLDRLRDALGLPAQDSQANFTTGGNEANLSGVLAALAHRFPGWRVRGIRALPARPALYLSGEAHHSMAKVVRMTGLGTESLRPVPVGQDFAMDVESLHRMIREDLRDGWSPFMVVATAGTTGTGAVDPLREVADVASSHGLWLHVDAAWGGAAVLSPTLKPLLAGIEKADSVTWDAHKWLAVPMGAGMFFCRHRDAVVRAFSVSTGYMPPDATDGIPDAYVSTPQWSRRAIGLKLFMAMAHLGEVGYARLIEAQAAMGERLRELLLREGWLVLNDTRLPVVCFTHERIRQKGTDPDRVLEALYRRGKVWISAVTLPTGERALRACVTSYLTDEKDLRVLLDELDEVLHELRPS